MKFFIHPGLRNLFKDLELITNTIIEADNLGFDGAVMPDHYMWGTRNQGKTPDDYITLETWITLTYLAAKTEKIRLGTLVTPIPFRPPSMLAKMLSTLDVLSNGRVVLGVGAGWSQEEFEGYSEWNEPKVRVDKTKEGLELIIKLWTQEEVTFEGKYYRAKAAVLEPKPIQKPYPQLLFGGHGDRMLRLAGKYADICYIMSQTSEDYEEMKEKVLVAADRANRADKIAFMAGFHIFSRIPYDSMEYIKRVEAAEEAGIRYFLMSFPRDQTFSDSMRSFAKEVMPSFK
ncbi:MAG: LLM class flavin-dependent oxidoreductase [Candidatus Hodarchaeota archaeon]